MQDIDRKQAFFNISVEMECLGAAPTVRFIEIVGEDIRYRVSPRHDLSLVGSLDHRLAKFVLNHLSQVSRPRMVLHEPEATISLPDTTLSNIQTLVSMSENRTQLVLIRFTEISGNPLAALRASMESVGASIQDVAIGAYESVFQAGLALTEANQSPVHSKETRPELHQARKRLEQNIETLLFNLKVLKRHVSRAPGSAPPNVENRFKTLPLTELEKAEKPQAFAAGQSCSSHQEREYERGFT